MREFVVVTLAAGDAAEFDGFIRKAAGLIRGGHKRVILHFPGEGELDSGRLRALHELLRTARRRFADVRVVAPSARMRETFLLTRLGIYAGIYGSLEEARQEEGFRPLVKYGSVVAWGLFVLLYAYTIRWLIFSWQIDPYYSHGPLVAAASAFLLWRRRKQIRSPSSALSPKGVSFLAVSALLYGIGQSRGVNFLLGVSLVFFLLGVVLLLYGGRVYRQAFLPTVLLLFAVPLPRLDEAASLLQHLTAGWTTALVSGVGMEIYHVGVNVFFGDVNIVIDAPCSGIRSLMALLFVGTVWVGLLKADSPRKALLLASVVPISVLSNLLRVTTLILVAGGYGLEMALFYFHYVSGLAFFSVALALLWLEAKLLRCGWEAA